MSLTTFVKRPEVADKLKLLRPKLPRKIAAPLRAEPRSNRYTLVGTAFDYLLRFELQRRAPHAIARTWVAEEAVEIISSLCPTGKGSSVDPALLVALDLDQDDDPLLIAEELAGRARLVVEGAKVAVAAYTEDKAPTRTSKVGVASHALRLASLDEVLRSGYMDSSIFDEPDPEDVRDLLDMLAIVPLDLLLHDKVLLLNPVFAESSFLVGGADADLIAGDLLLDFKVTKAAEMQAVQLDQLFGYFLLSRNERRLDPAFPEINRLGIYFCRHGHLWTQDVTLWTAHPQFAGLEDWFFKHAGEVFPRR